MSRCTHNSNVMTLAALMLCASTADASLATQPITPGGSAPDQPLNQADAPASRTPLPTLEQLLGLDEEPRQDAAPASGLDPTLENQLSQSLRGETAPDDPFQAAVELINQSAARLQGSSDAGAATQRLQRDAIARLEQAISIAQSQSQQQSQSSSQSSDSSSQQQQPDQQQSRSQQQQQQAGSESGESSAPGLNGVDEGPDLAGSTAAWGALPDRLRGALLQGVSDEYSTIYQRLTEEYYRRLAEDRDER